MNFATVKPYSPPGTPQPISMSGRVTSPAYAEKRIHEAEQQFNVIASILRSPAQSVHIFGNTTARVGSAEAWSVTVSGSGDVASAAAAIQAALSASD